MAEVVEVSIVDDIDGGQADESIHWSIDGQALVIDLSKRNATAFRKAVQKYKDASRRDSAPRKRGGSRSPVAAGEYSAARAWGAENGITVPARGRLSSEFMEAYNAGNVAAAKKALK